MNTKSLVDSDHDSCRDKSKLFPDLFNCNRSDLLGLRLGVALEASDSRLKEHLELVYRLHIGSDRDDSDDAATQASRR